MVAAARRTLGERRIGHTGTLDPFATGLLVLCVGRATRLARFLAEGIKEYVADVRLGFATTTDDGTGAPLGPETAVDVPDDALAAALAALTGRIAQRPPAFSAKHVDGRRAHALARAGEEVQLPAVEVRVDELRVLAREGHALRLLVRCSPGTYVRALARDLGEQLGVGGHLAALRRTASGTLSVAEAVPFPDLAGWRERLLPMASLLTEMPGLQLDDPQVALVRQGREIDPGTMPAAARVRLLDGEGRLLALAVPRGLRLHPDLVLA